MDKRGKMILLHSFGFKQERSSFWWSGKRRLSLKQIKQIIKLLKKEKLSVVNICVDCAIRRIKGLSSIVN